MISLFLSKIRYITQHFISRQKLPGKYRIKTEEKNYKGKKTAVQQTAIFRFYTLWKQQKSQR